MFEQDSESLEWIFAHHVVPVLLVDGVFGEPTPRAVLLVGQPGAGKTALARTLRGQVETGARPLIVGRSDLRPFLPGYYELVAEHGQQEADARTDGDAGRLMHMTLDHIHQLQVSVIIDDVLTDLAYVAELASWIKSAPGLGSGYTVEVAVLATPTASSELECVAQVQRSREYGVTEHHPGQDVLDRAAAGVLDVVDWAETSTDVDEISLYRGGSGPIALRDRDRQGGWVHHDLGGRLPANAAVLGARALVERTRALELSPAEGIDWLRLYDRLRVQLPPRWRRALAHASAMLNLAPVTESETAARRAVTFGRFQIVTPAHVDAVRDILREHSALTIGILDVSRGGAASSELAPPVKNFIADRQRAAAPELNPITVGEQMTMWRNALIVADLIRRVDLEVIGRPELDPADFNRRFDPDTFDVVLLETTTEPHEAYLALLARPITTPAPAMSESGPDLRHQYLAGDPAWRTQIAVGALEVFELIDGPARLFEQTPAQPIPESPTNATMAVGRQIDTVVDDAVRAVDPEVASPPGPHPQRRATDPHSIAATIQDALPSSVDRSTAGRSDDHVAESEPTARRIELDSGPSA